MRNYWDIAKRASDIFEVKKKSITTFTTISTNYKEKKIECKKPFNLNFESKIKNDYFLNEQDLKNKLSGPGIYVITYDKKVIYIGSYSSKKSNIIKDRWVKHISTMTNRGYRLGFNAKSKQNKIPKNLKVDFDNESFRYGDTGNNTTLERLQFASINYNKFRNLDDNSLINKFFFYYKKIKSKPTILEKKLINHFEPICNFIKKRKYVKNENIREISINSIKEKIKNMI